MKIVLRPAASDDIAVLKYWDRQPHVLKARNLAEPDADWIWEIEIDRNPHWRELLIGEVDGEPVAFIQIIDPAEEETHYWGDVANDQKAIDIWIGEEPNLGKGFGTILMQLAIDRCFKNERVQNVLIDPLEENKRAHQFYERLGFTFALQKMFGEDRCFVYQLSRPAWTAFTGKLPKVECSGGVIAKGGKFLLGKRSAAASWYPAVWDVFGGHAERGETPADTLIRELHEELNIIPTSYRLSGVLEYFEGSVHKKVRYHHFFVTEWTGPIKNRGIEHTEIRWFTRPELDAVPLAAKEYLSLIDKWMHARL